ncbi:hypothetical protein [Elioraea sp.]|uniref:hypothetical protein n=1 Tax=Elioraea sp. TaxID=2185103 RepID=UPI0025C41B25|nr:hypothetical protein [Elioraea sp.]
MTETDPRLMLAGPAACHVFVRLMRLAAVMGSDGFLAFGSAIRNLKEVSIAVAINETELETHVETLVARGVLVREGDVLACPPLREAGRKSAAARANGGLGGRPRKGERPEDARARRQGEIMLPIAGGKPTGTETGTLSRATAAASSSEELSNKQASKPREEATTLMQLGRAVLDAALIDDAKWMGDFRAVSGWLAMGLDAETILATVQRVAGRSTYTAPRSLGYFTEAMKDAASALVPVPPKAEPAWMSHPDYPAWRAAMDAYHGYGPGPVMSASLASARAQGRGEARAA